jgi:Tfp pilus assembly protein PilF
VHSDPGSRRAHALLAVLYSKRSRVSDAEKQQAIAATLEDQKIKQWTIWGVAPQVKN